MAETDLIPPYSFEAEQSVLGCMLINQDAANQAMDSLDEEAFYTLRHKQIFAAIKEVVHKGLAVDIITINDELIQEGLTESTGGIVYLSQMAQNVPTAANARHYISIVEEKYMLRRIIDIGNSMVRDGYEQKDLDAILENTQKLIYELSVKKNSSSFVTLEEALVKSYAKIEEASKSKTGITGVPTGFIALDEMTTGLHGGELVILAGRPGTGKTSLALNIAANIARTGLAVAVFSLEMSCEQLATRILCTDALIDLKKVRGGQLEEEEILTMAESFKRLTKYPVYIDDTTGITVGQARLKSMRLGRKKKLGLIIIDYLQLMTGSGKSENRVLEVAEITRSLKGIARTMDTPVMALSQLSRDMEKRKGKPMLSDLRESGAIEQDADIVMFLYKNQSEEEEGADPFTINLSVAKNRSGPTDMIDLQWEPEYTRFRSKDYTHSEA